MGVEPWRDVRCKSKSRWLLFQLLPPIPLSRRQKLITQPIWSGRCPTRWERKKGFRTPNKSRTEMAARCHAMISIVVRTTRVAITLDREKHTYFKMDLGQKDDDAISMANYTTVLLGEEMVGGMQTSKYSYEGTTNGMQMKGTVWMTKYNIPVRNVATVVASGQTISVASHLENLKIEKLDPSLFEVPAGYAVRQTFGPGDKK